MEDGRLKMENGRWKMEDGRNAGLKRINLKKLEEYIKGSNID